MRIGSWPGAGSVVAWTVDPFRTVGGSAGSAFRGSVAAARELAGADAVDEPVLERALRAPRGTVHLRSRKRRAGHAACRPVPARRAARSSRPSPRQSLRSREFPLLLYLTNGNLLGGGKPVLTGPTIVDKTNIDQIAKFASAGTR